MITLCTNIQIICTYFLITVITVYCFKCFITTSLIIGLFILGVADGVGGWRAYGIDPGEFSLHLMKSCERLVNLGRFSPNNPSELLASSYYELLHNKKAILGEYS